MGSGKSPGFHDIQNSYDLVVKSIFELSKITPRKLSFRIKKLKKSPRYFLFKLKMWITYIHTWYEVLRENGVDCRLFFTFKQIKDILEGAAERWNEELYLNLIEGKHNSSIRKFLNNYPLFKKEKVETKEGKTLVFYIPLYRGDLEKKYKAHATKYYKKCKFRIFYPFLKFCFNTITVIPHILIIEVFEEFLLVGKSIKNYIEKNKCMVTNNEKVAQAINGIIDKLEKLVIEELLQPDFKKKLNSCKRKVRNTKKKYCIN